MRGGPVGPGSRQRGSGGRAHAALLPCGAGRGGGGRHGARSASCPLVTKRTPG